MTIKSAIYFFILLPVSLSAQQRVSLKTTATEAVQLSSPVSAVQVITSLSDSTSLGYKTGLSPDGNCTEWLQKYVSTQYKSSFTKEGRKLLWIVKDISVGNDVGNTDTWVLQLKADVYAATADNGYNPLFSIDTVLVGADYSTIIKDGMQALFVRSAVTTADKKTSVPVSELVNKTRSKFNVKILKDSIYQQGIYLSFEEFKRNSPSLTNVLLDQNSEGKVTVYQLSSDSVRTPVDNAWGISIRNELYALKDGHLIPLEHLSDGMVLSKFRAPGQRRNQGSFWRNYIDQNPFSEKIIFPVKMSSVQAQPEATRIDMETGTLTF